MCLCVVIILIRIYGNAQFCRTAALVNYERCGYIGHFVVALCFFTCWNDYIFVRSGCFLMFTVETIYNLNSVIRFHGSCIRWFYACGPCRIILPKVLGSRICCYRHFKRCNLYSSFLLDYIVVIRVGNSDFDGRFCHHISVRIQCFAPGCSTVIAVFHLIFRYGSIDFDAV